MELALSGPTMRAVGAFAPERLGAVQRGEAAADEQLIPAGPILLGQGYQRPVRSGARGRSGPSSKLRQITLTWAWSPTRATAASKRRLPM